MEIVNAYLAELLHCFSADVEQWATDAIWKKYETLYASLM